MTAPPRLFDRRRLRQRLARAEALGHPAEFLRQRVADDLASRLVPIMRAFPVAVDLAARGGAVRRALIESGLDARIGLLVEADPHPSRRGPGETPSDRVRVAADEDSSPFADGRIDLAVSNLALHAVDDLPGALLQVRRALRPGGLFLGSVFCAGTLDPLRQALTQAESEILGGAGPRVAPFLRPPDAPALLQRAGFLDPVVDLEAVRVAYREPLSLFSDLRGMGETAILVNGAERPLRRDVLARTLDLCREMSPAPGGGVTVTFEIATLTGWAPPA